jgi:hypothetical protein
VSDWKSSGWHGRDPGGRGWTENGGSTPCKANCPCTSAADAEHKRGAESCANRQRCRTAGAGCTAECRRGFLRETATPGSTDTTLQRLSPGGSLSGNCCPTPWTRQSASEARNHPSVLTMSLLHRHRRLVVCSMSTAPTPQTASSRRHPTLKGKQLRDIKGKHGAPLGETIMENATQGTIKETTYWWPRPGSDKPREKTSAVGYYKE